MPTIDDIRAAAAEHARQLESVRWLSVADLVARWGVSQTTIRAIAADDLPYLLFGKSRVRRYDPRDVEAYEDRMKHASHPPRAAVAQEPAA